MHLKQNGHSFGVLLIYTITTISLHSTGWCKPSAHSLQTERGEEEEWRELPHNENLEGTAAGKPISLTPTMSTSSLKNKPRQVDYHLNGNCSGGNTKHVVQGKFYITGQLETNIPAPGYQSDAAVSGQIQGGRVRIGGQTVSSSEESWQNLQPVVECEDEGMTLTVRRRRAVHLLLDRANESSVPLSQLPPQCGYSVQTTWRDLSLMAQYDACHITVEDDSYVLPLLWRGAPVRMSCPVSRITPQATGPSSLCCSQHGMTVKVKGLSAADELRINVRGEWIPLSSLVEYCGYTVDKRDAEIVINTPYVTCGIIVKDGHYTLSLQIGEEVFTLACPVSPPEQLPITPQPPQPPPPPLLRGATKNMQAPQKPFQWAPPFYLAPPYYPHPTKRHSYTSRNLKDLYNPTAPSLTPKTPRPLRPPVDSLPDNQVYSFHHIPLKETITIHSPLSSRDEMDETRPLYLTRNQESPVLDLSEKQSTTPPKFPAQVEAPNIQPPRYDFNPYYHYYHHPKIPLPGPSQDFDPGPQLSGEVSHDRDFLVFPPNVQLSEDLSPTPVADTISRPYTLPTNPKFAHNPPALHATHPPQPYPHFYHFPHIVPGEAKRLHPLRQDTAAKTHLANVHSLPHPLLLQDNANPYTQEPSPDTDAEEYSQEWTEHLFLSDDVKPEPDDDRRRSAHPDPESDQLPEQPSYLTPLYNPYHYYYNPYQMYEGLLKHSSSLPAQHPTYPKHPSTAPPTESVYDVQNDPYYYYSHLYNQPKEFKHDQELHPTSSEGSEKELPSDFQYGRVEWVVHGAEGGYANIPVQLHNPSHGLYSRYITQQHSYDPFRQQSGEEAEVKLGNEMRVPGSVVESTALPSEDSYVYCWLERLTPDLDIYMIPLDGCGLKHTLGEKEVKVSDSDSHQAARSETSMRLMVGCDEEKDRPPLPQSQSTPVAVNVQLRIATDESFTSYHPGAHLPLSLIQGRLVFVELRLLDPPDPNLVLLVHSCVAYTQYPYASWTLVYNGCPSWGVSQLLPSTNSHHIRKIVIYSFLSTPIEGYSFLGEPEIYFSCLTEVCSAADSECSVNCVKDPNSDVQ